MLKRFGLLIGWLAVMGKAAAAPDLEKQARDVAQAGVKWLLEQQQPGGYWSNKDFPALTALPLWALLESGANNEPAVAKAVDYLLSCVHEDGSIWQTPSVQQKGGGLATYNTALCMVALHRTGRADLVPVVQRARRFLAASQHLDHDLFRGGMGYDPSTGRPYADLSNSYLAYEAMRLTQNVEDLRAAGEGRADLDWEAARAFIQRVQNRPESNDQPWASDDPEQHGGFAYKPDSSQAGTFTDAEGVVRFRSYGSMTYAGLLSFLYANVDHQDPRVQSAFDWASRHWTLEENPGMGAEGLYYFYNVLSKALAAFGQPTIQTGQGVRVDWREALIRKLIALRREAAGPEHSFWVNNNNRWWEADPVLVTSYSLLALAHAMNLNPSTEGTAHE